MKHNEFKIGTQFRCGEGTFRCTDVGTRVIVAVNIDEHADASWYVGPPYAVIEHVFDENDMKGCKLT